jgi:hypothetical protein
MYLVRGPRSAVRVLPTALLFLCYINDNPDVVQSKIRLFADDCLLYRPIQTFIDHSKLQDDLQELEKWAKTWGMQFNAKNCYIVSTKAKSSYVYSLCGHILQSVPSNPYI